MRYWFRILLALYIVLILGLAGYFCYSIWTASKIMVTSNLPTLNSSLLKAIEVKLGDRQAVATSSAAPLSSFKFGVPEPFK